MQSSVAALSSPVVDGYCPIVSDTTALIFISGRDRMPVGRLGLKAGWGMRDGQFGPAVHRGVPHPPSPIPHPATLYPHPNRTRRASARGCDRGPPLPQEADLSA